MNAHTTAIRQSLAQGKNLWGGLRMIDEEAFFIATTKMRHSIATPAIAPKSVDQISKYLEAMESLIENGKGRVMGRVIVRPADFEPHLQALEAALRALPPFENLPQSAEPTIEAAKLEASRIIEEAHREADEIRRRAREAG